MLSPPIGSGRVEGGIDIGPQDERAGRRRHPIADDARLALLHEVADALVRVAVHDPVARTRGAPLPVEVGRVQREIRQTNLALDQHAAAGDQEDLLADQVIEQPDRPAVDVSGRLEHLRLVVRDDRTAQLRLDRLNLEPDVRRAVDPHRPAIERVRRIDRVEPDDERRPSADRVHAVEPVRVVLVQPQVERQRQHLLGLHERKRRTIGRPLRAVQLEAQLLPFDGAVLREEAVLGHEVVRRIGRRRMEMLFDAHVGDVVPQDGVLRGLRLLMTKDDLLDPRQRFLPHVDARAEAAAVAEVEIDDQRMVGHRKRHPQSVVLRTLLHARRRQGRARHRIAHHRRRHVRDGDLDLERCSVRRAPVDEEGLEPGEAVHQAMRDGRRHVRRALQDAKIGPSARRG